MLPLYYINYIIIIIISCSFAVTVFIIYEQQALFATISLLFLRFAYYIVVDW